MEKSLLSKITLLDFLRIYSLKELMFRYAFFKFLLSLIILLLGIGLLIFSYFSSVTSFYLFNKYWLMYLLYYWAAKWYYLVVIIIGYLILFGNLLKNLFLEYLQFIIEPKKTDSIFYSQVNGFSNIFLFISIPITFIAIPLSNLTFSNFLQKLAFTGINVFGTLLFFFWRYIYRDMKDALKPINSLTYVENSFNTASMGGESAESKEEVNYYLNEIKGDNPTNENARNFVEKGSPLTKFKGFKQFFVNLGTLLDSEKTIRNIHEKLSIHKNTTEAIKHALSVIASNQRLGTGIYILYLDTCYPSIERKIFELQSSNKNLIKAEKISVYNQIKESKIDFSIISNLILNRIESIRSLEKKPFNIIVVMSHVIYKLGIVFDVGDFLRKLNKDESIYTIIDGAQAVGNISIPPDVLQLCDYYAGCGHKWLLSKNSIGFLYHNIDLLESKGILGSETLPSDSYTTYNYTSSEFSDTRNLDVYISLNISLLEFNSIGIEKIEAHNIRLGRYFYNLVQQNPIFKVITSPIQCGIVSIKVELDNFDKLYDFLSSNYNIVCEHYDEEHLLRFSFHYFMGSRHIHYLIHSLNEAHHAAIY